MPSSASAITMSSTRGITCHDPDGHRHPHRLPADQSAKLDHLLRTLPVAICGVVRAEILAGARNPKDRQRLITFLQPFQYVTMPESSWDRVGDNLAVLYAAGGPVPFPDAIIATLGIENDIEVWARDPHYQLIQKRLPALKLFQEPP
jgi:predicted nucleic acid-binding protein